MMSMPPQGRLGRDGMLRQHAQHRWTFGLHGSGATQAEAAVRCGVAPFSRVVVFEDLIAVRPMWDHLQALAPSSPYQCWAWARAWMETEGRCDRLVPWIPVALSAEGRPLALLPLAIRRRGRVHVGLFLGGQQTNYNMGLFDPALPWTSRHAEAMLRRAAAITPGGVDLFTLFNQPESWDGIVNPLSALDGSRPSPSLGHRAVLQGDAAAFFKVHQSGAARKKLRAKAANLAALGPVRYGRAETTGEIEAVVQAHVAQKAAKLAALGIPHTDPDRLRAYLRAAACGADGTPGPLELHALWCDGRVVATFGGVAHAGRFSGSVISHDLSPSVARCSPGELLLTAVIGAKCEAGFAGFDLGIGEARYKDSLCPVVDPLVDGFLALTTKGRALAAASATRQALKARVKRSPRLWRLAQAVRRAKAVLRGR